MPLNTHCKQETLYRCVHKKVNLGYADTCIYWIKFGEFRVKNVNSISIQIKIRVPLPVSMYVPLNITIGRYTVMSIWLCSQMSTRITGTREPWFTGLRQLSLYFWPSIDVCRTMSAVHTKTDSWTYVGYLLASWDKNSVFLLLSVENGYN